SRGRACSSGGRPAPRCHSCGPMPSTSSCSARGTTGRSSMAFRRWQNGIKGAVLGSRWRCGHSTGAFARYERGRCCASPRRPRFVCDGPTTSGPASRTLPRDRRRPASSSWTFRSRASRRPLSASRSSGPRWSAGKAGISRSRWRTRDRRVRTHGGRHDRRGGQETRAGHPGHEMATGSHAGHDRHAGHSVATFRDNFGLSFALTTPVGVWSREVQHWLGYTAPTFPGSAFIPAILGTFILLYGGLVFLRGARGELADRQPGMMTLISLAITVAFVTSLAATLGLFAIDIWWELATLITIMLLGHWLEMRAIAQARGVLDALAARLPDSAERVTDTRIESVPLAALRTGDLILVRPGARVPADGIVAEGAADVDESMITGESRPVAKE